MIKFEVRFDDGEVFTAVDTLQEARDIRSENNFTFLSRSLHIYQINTEDSWAETEVF
jgi:hypothetical protein